VADARRIFLLRGLRAFAYGFTSVVLGVHLAHLKDAHHLSSFQVGAIVTAALGGAAALSALLGARGDRIGRRRAHVALSFAMAGAMAVFAFTSSFLALFLLALTGTVATTFLEAGPFVALEQAMLPNAVPQALRTRSFGRYSAIAYVAGSVGSLAAGGPDAIRHYLHTAPSSQRWFLLPAFLALISAAIAVRLSPTVEAPAGDRKPLGPSRKKVYKLSALFALDGLGGGFVVNTLIIYWFSSKFGTSTAVLGVIFFGVGLLQGGSVLVASRIAERIGLVKTMVFTHLPSNLLLIAIPLVHSQAWAVVFLLARFALSQMDVPARQSYVVAVVTPEERTAASSFTTTAKSAAQAVSPSISGPAVQAAGTGLPFYLGGGLKILYDILLWRSFRKIHTPEEEARHIE
jgi:MFS family permease